MSRRTLAVIAAASLAITHVSAQEAVFKAGIEIVDVAVTVTDGDGRFVTGLTKDDFVVSEDGKPQAIVSFSSERVPVSLAMLLDVSASMTEDQLATASVAIDHFIFDLLDSEDELLLMEFAGRDRILQSWTRDREMFSRALARAKQVPLDPIVEQPDGTVMAQSVGTAIYDAVATSLRLAAMGVHRKKAILVLSDGDDTSSHLTVKQVQDSIRASDVMVYALGVDGGGSAAFGSLPASVNTRALRRLTDETGGRTEVVKGFRNLEKATARLAAEFNQQYLIGYAAPSKRDGRWHSIKVDVRKKGSKVRARTGYTAS